jgi:hypothetical protein
MSPCVEPKMIFNRMLRLLITLVLISNLSGFLIVSAFGQSEASSSNQQRDAKSESAIAALSTNSAGFPEWCSKIRQAWE